MGITVGKSYDLNAAEFFNATQVLTPVQKQAVNDLVKDLKGCGIWTKMKAVYPFVGGTNENPSPHAFNLKDPRDLDAAFRLVFEGGFTHSSDGVLSNGIDAYADSKFIPSTHLQDIYSVNIGCYIKQANIGSSLMGGQTGSANRMRFNVINGTMEGCLYSANVIRNFLPTVSVTTNLGFACIGRTNTTDMFGYIGGIFYLGSSGTTSGTSTVSTYIFAENNNDTPSRYSNTLLNFAYISDGLSQQEATTLDTVVQRFQTTLGRQV
jgi:hypothetical protein